MVIYLVWYLAISHEAQMFSAWIQARATGTLLSLTFLTPVAKFPVLKSSLLRQQQQQLPFTEILYTARTSQLIPQVPGWQTHETPWAGWHQPGLAAWATARRTWWTRCSKVHPETGGGSSGATPAAQGWEWWWTLTPEHLLVFSCLGCYCDREAKNPRSIPAGRVHVVA